MYQETHFSFCLRPQHKSVQHQWGKCICYLEMSSVDIYEHVCLGQVGVFHRHGFGVNAPPLDKGRNPR